MNEQMKVELADVSKEEILDAITSGLNFAVEQFGDEIDAKSVDLRLWVSAALVQSTIAVSVRSHILESFRDKLSMMGTVVTRKDLDKECRNQSKH